MVWLIQLNRSIRRIWQTKSTAAKKRVFFFFSIRRFVFVVACQYKVRSAQPLFFTLRRQKSTMPRKFNSEKRRKADKLKRSQFRQARAIERQAKSSSKEKGKL